MYQPRPYEVQALRAIAKARKEGRRRALVVMASGLGKTVVAGFDVRRFLGANPGSKVLYICHQNDILRQARTELTTNILPMKYSHGFMIGDERDIHGVDMLYASFQTMHRHRTHFRRSEFDYIVVDESHHGPAPTYLPTLEYFTPKFMLAITATPDRMDQQDIGEIYGQPVFKLELEEAWAKGLLTPVDYRVVTDEWQNLTVLETPVGKLSVKQLNKTLFVPKRDDEIIRVIEEKLADIPNPRVVIFSPRIDHAEHIAERMQGAIALHSRLSEREQADRLKAFRDGNYRAVSTVDMFNEGIDVPEANVIVFLRSTASRTIFFQQLGRGLRLSDGKKQVLVLDFVANCDRLVMLEDLRKGLNRQLTHFRTGSGFGETALIVDAGDFEFDEVARDVLRVVTAIRLGYTKEQIVEQLQSLSMELGRVPQKSDVEAYSRRGRCASPPTMGKLFGSLFEALTAAGLAPSGRAIRRFSDDEIARDLVQLASQLGHVPTMPEVDKASKSGEIANSSTISDRFGGYNKALVAAGLKPRNVNWSRADLIAQLTTLAGELGRTPKVADVNDKSAKGGCAYSSTFNDRFGSFPNALRAAGLQPTRESGWTRAEALEQLRILAEDLHKVPSNQDVTRSAREFGSPGLNVYTRMFGSVGSAITELSLNPRTRRPIESAEKLLDQLRGEEAALGRPITVRDIEALPRNRIASSATFKRRFGGLPEARALAGLFVSVRASDELVLGQLREQEQAAGKVLTGRDMDRLSHEGKAPSTSQLRQRFGSYGKARALAGLPVGALSEDVVIAALVREEQLAGRYLALSDIAKLHRAGRFPLSITSMLKRFGRYSDIRRRAGLDVIETFQRYTDEELLASLRKLYDAVGKPLTPTIIGGSEIKKQTYVARFGSLENACSMARVPFKRQGSRPH
jgi:superfamily II DNA or RNA helicase